MLPSKDIFQGGINVECLGEGMVRKFFRASTKELKKLSIENRKNAAVLKTLLDELKHRNRPKALELKRKIENWLKELSKNNSAQQSSTPPNNDAPPLLKDSPLQDDSKENNKFDEGTSVEEPGNQKNGVEKSGPSDFATVITTQRELAEQGNAEAQTLLGAMYHTGQGVPQDNTQAMEWYRKAAEQGNSLAQNNLGVMYWKGMGVPRDDVTALRWFILAEAGGSEGGKENRIKLAGEMSVAEISEAERLASDSPQSNGRLGNGFKAIFSRFRRAGSP